MAPSLTFRPMRAIDCDLHRDPVPKVAYASDKIDGVRVIKYNGLPFSRAMTQVRNKELHQFLTSYPDDNFEAEFVALTDDGKNRPFDETSGLFRSFSKPLGNFRLHVFDRIDLEKDFGNRVRSLATLRHNPHISIVPQTLCSGKEQFISYYATALQRGAEGIVIKNAYTKYKLGHSTLSEGEYLRVKPFLDDEATIVSFEELHHNDNPQTTNEVGLSERSSHSENLRPGGVLGAFIVSWRGKTFRVGTGLSAAQREEFWKTRETLINRKLTFKYQPTHMTDVPTPAIFKSLR